MAHINIRLSICEWDIGGKRVSAPIQRKRSLIKKENDKLKNVCQIAHARHRAINNFATNRLAGLIAYNWMARKPEMNKKSLTKAGLLRNIYIEPRIITIFVPINVL